MIKLHESLVEAERHVAEGQALLDAQRTHAAKFTRHGQEARGAEQLLVQFEVGLQTLIADRDRLRRLVASIESDWPQSESVNAYGPSWCAVRDRLVAIRQER
jgi:hypothetical protein